MALDIVPTWFHVRPRHLWHPAKRTTLKTCAQRPETLGQTRESSKILCLQFVWKNCRFNEGIECDHQTQLHIALQYLQCKDSSNMNGQAFFKPRRFLSNNKQMAAHHGQLTSSYQNRMLSTNTPMSPARTPEKGCPVE